MNSYTSKRFNYNCIHINIMSVIHQWIFCITVVEKLHSCYALKQGKHEKNNSKFNCTENPLLALKNKA